MKAASRKRKENAKPPAGGEVPAGGGMIVCINQSRLKSSLLNQ